MGGSIYFTLAALTMVSMTSGVVWAQNPHYNKGRLASITDSPQRAPER